MDMREKRLVSLDPDNWLGYSDIRKDVEELTCLFASSINRLGVSGKFMGIQGPFVLEWS